MEEQLGVKGSADVSGYSYRVGLSPEYGRSKMDAGGMLRRSSEEYRVANGDAVTGKGLRRTGEEVVDDAADTDKEDVDSNEIKGL
jgi:hypothetical protein